MKKVQERSLARITVLCIFVELCENEKIDERCGLCRSVSSNHLDEKKTLVDVGTVETV